MLQFFSHLTLNDQKSNVERFGRSGCRREKALRASLRRNKLRGLGFFLFFPYYIIHITRPEPIDNKRKITEMIKNLLKT